MCIFGTSPLLCSISYNTICCKVSLYIPTGRASVFLSKPPLYHVSLTDTASITCSASENYVSYQWIIESGSFPSKVIGIYSNTLVIPNVTSSDENTYTCRVTTQRGCVSSNTTELITSGMILILAIQLVNIIIKYSIYSMAPSFRCTKIL